MYRKVNGTPLFFDVVGSYTFYFTIRMEEQCHTDFHENRELSPKSRS